MAILGSRQCGKTTLTHQIVKKIIQSVYLDLENPADLAKLDDPFAFFNLHNDELVCLDEIQRTPELFSILRSIIDERDIGILGFRMSPVRLGRLWKMCAHIHDSLINASKLADSLGVSSHPIIGASFEGFAMENILANATNYQASFYRTGAGAEIDLILRKGRQTLAFELKSSTVPKVSKGFWNALDDLSPDEAYVVAPVKEPYLIKGGVMVNPLQKIIARLQQE